MRFQHPDGSTVHLAYCTNVHPAEDLDGIIDQLRRFSEPIRLALGWPRLGVGLWLSAPVAHQLANDEDSLERLRNALDERHLEAVTFNGFPYRAFHADVVQLDVYQPDWTTPERLEYTLDLAKVLQGLLPGDIELGTISTLPIAWRDPAPDVAEAQAALKQLSTQLAKLATGGPAIKLAIEPEPGCIVETVEQAAPVIAAIDPEWIGLCLDACHLAVQFEDAATAAGTLANNGVSIYKSQLSSAVRVASPKDADWLPAFVEPRLLHQTRENAPGGVLSVDNLDQALDGGLPGNDEWRVHFHVPVNSDDGRTTRDELLKTMGVLVGGPRALTHHLEVETYTWTILPEDRRPQDDEGLIDGIARELEWTADQLIALGLKPEKR